jgi:hypothetical protein
MILKRVFNWRKVAVLLLFSFLLSVPSYAESRPYEGYTKLPRKKWLKEVESARNNSLLWIKNNFRDKGLWQYMYEPSTDQFSTRNNEIRQLMTSVLAAKYAGKDSIFSVYHKKNLEFIFKFWYKENQGLGYVQYDGKSKLGGNAMFLRALVHSPVYSSYVAQAKKLAMGIISLIQEDGSFVPWFRAPAYEFDPDYLLTFYSGEAILALLEYYEKSGDAIALSAATKVQNFYLQRYVDDLEQNYYPAYVPWHSLSLNKLYRITSEKRYLEAILVLNDELLKILDKKQFPGRFYNPEYPQYGTPHTSSDGVYTEGLIYAYEAAGILGNKKKADEYYQAMQLASMHLIKAQYQSDLAKIHGGIRINEDDARIRLDNVQHTVDAFDKILEVFSK